MNAKQDNCQVDFEPTKVLINRSTDIIDELLDSAYSYFKGLRDQEIVLPKLVHTSANKLSTLIGINVKNASSGDLERKQCNVKLFEYFDGITLQDFVQSRRPNLVILSETYFHVGRMCSHLFEFFHTQNHLVDQLGKSRQNFSWQLATCEQFLRNQLEVPFSAQTDEDKHSLVEKVLKEYSGIRDKLNSLPQFVVHSDLSTRNILMDTKTSSKPTCLVDFGDVQVGNQLTDLAVAMLYGVLVHETNFGQALIEIPAQILRGYQSVNLSSSSSMLTEDELEMAPTLMKLRLCQSLINAQLASKRDPRNSCTTTTLKNGWTLLKLLVLDERYSNSDGLVSSWRKPNK